MFNAIASQGMTANQVASLDLETAMIAVQSDRTELLEIELKSQINAVQAKNDQVSKLNALMAELNAALALLPANATQDSTLTKDSTQKSDIVRGLTEHQKARINACLDSLGIQAKDLFGYDSGEGLNFNDIPKSKLDTGIAKLKGQVDSLSNTQQMDMLRLQSLSNKRNESFDLMSNFIKKMTDGRSAIIGNMR